MHGLGVRNPDVFRIGVRERLAIVRLQTFLKLQGCDLILHSLQFGVHSGQSLLVQAESALFDLDQKVITVLRGRRKLDFFLFFSVLVLALTPAIIIAQRPRQWHCMCMLHWRGDGEFSLIFGATGVIARSADRTILDPVMGGRGRDVLGLFNCDIRNGKDAVDPRFFGVQVPPMVPVCV